MRVILKHLPPEDPRFPHGYTGYQYGCRCKKCHRETLAYKAYHRRKTGEVPTTTKYVPRDQIPVEHGTRKQYQRGCRTESECPNTEYPCIQANRDYAASAWRLKTMGVKLHDPWIEAALAL